MALDFVAGCLGGCAGVIVGHPLDTVKVNLQTQDFRNPQYRGTIHCMKSLLSQHGVRGVYRGVASPLFGVAGINAMVFGVYGVVQRNLNNPESIRTITIAGATAGLVQSFITSPMELVKSRLQVMGNSNTSSLECLRNIFKSEGVKGVYRGLGITIAREVPAFGSYFLSYEILTRTVNNEPVSTFKMLLSGGLAGIISWTIVYPIDVLKSRMQVDDLSNPKYRNSYDCFRKSVLTDGYMCLFRGLTPTLLRAFPVNAVTFAVVTWTIRILNDEGISESVHETESIWRRCTDAVHTLNMTDRVSV